MKTEHLLSFAVLVVSAQAGPATSLPQYRFKPGQELVYESSSKFEHQNGAHHTTDKRTFWVTRQNPDGSCHIVAQRENTFSQRPRKESSHSPPPRKQTSFDAFDVFPDGRIPNAPEGFEEQGLTEPLFKLPADLASGLAGWKVEESEQETQLYRIIKEAQPDEGVWVFEKTDQGLFKDVYSMTSESKIFFDAKRGLITKRESENTQDYGFKGRGTGRTELKSTRTRDADWMAQLERETEILIQAKAEVRKAMAALRKEAKADNVLEGAKQHLEAGRDKSKLPEVRAQFEAQLESFEKSSKYATEDKEREQTVLNKPAAFWETTDLEGKTHSLDGYRGKVVVLDFWYRGCGWCIRAMPQIKQVTDDFRDQPVAVLGMNTDREEKDAQFVVNKLKLNYPTLKATGIPEQYGVQAFPTLIVIDGEGIVRARHVGYAPDLREEIGKIIKGLLADAKQR